MKKKRNTYYIIAGVIISLLIGISGGTFYHYMFSPVFNIQETKYLYIDSNDNIDSVRNKIIETASPKSLLGFNLLTRYYKYDQQIKTGRYPINPSDNAKKMFRRLYSGWQSPVKLIVPSVRTIDRLTQALDRQLMINSEDLLKLLKDSAYIEGLGYNEVSLPCLFIPNTYEVYWDVSPEKLISRMQKEHKHFWNKERIDKAATIKMTPEEITILASIVDEETANNTEKPMIAGLYINRLHRGMLLQADPTVKFALQDFSLKRIYNIHLKTDSPYNTYMYGGLPIGPIRIPSIAGIESVLNYTQHSYLYMCAKEDFSGTHNFARTLSEHLNNARRYQQALNRRNIK